MSTSRESNSVSSISSNGTISTPWGWLVWSDPRSDSAIPLWSQDNGHVATVGRGVFCTVPVPPTLVENALFERISREHCTLKKSSEDGKVTLMNHSPNGTFVNGERVRYLRTLPVDHGSVISLCSADSKASFTFYDNYHVYLGYHLDLNNRYLVMSVVASGAFGEICRAIVKGNSAVVAIKTVHATTRGSPFASVMVNPRGVTKLRNEIDVLSQLEHPCIVKVLDSAGDWPANRMVIVMEFLGGGDLQQRMFDVGHLSEQTARYFFVQMISAVKYCHERSPPIVHRDLNPANILLADADEFARVKVADFGLSKQLYRPSTLRTYCGTNLYIAPEVRRQLSDEDAEPYTAAVDVWSLGVILHYMLFGRHPSCSRADYTGRSTSTQRSSMLDGNGVPVSDAVHDLLENMLAVDVGRRHDVGLVASCPWVQDEETLIRLQASVFKGDPVF